MKVGMITFHNGSNYGASLQTYALQETLRELYQEVCIINYKNPFIMQGLNRIRLGKSLRYIYFTISDVINYKSNGIKIKRFYNFFEKYYNLTKLMDKHQLINTDLNCDLYVSGSDQIWNPLLNDIVDESYFCQFSGVKNRIAYASSIGNYKFTNKEWNAAIQEYLKSYNKISVRENADLIHQHVGLLPETVIDPTLLLTIDDWKNKFKLTSRAEEYVLVYAMGNSKKILAFAKRVAQEKGCKIKYIGNELRSDRNVIYIKEAGPIEFVDLFYNALYVVTNSFHGTAFSVNFRKQFASIYNEKSPQRAEQFLDNVGLNKYLIKDMNLPIKEVSADEFDNAHKYLKKQRNFAKEFLSEIRKGK